MTRAGWYALWQTPVSLLLVLFGGPWIDLLGYVFAVMAGANVAIAIQAAHPDFVERANRWRR